MMKEKSFYINVSCELRAEWYEMEEPCYDWIACGV